MEHPRGFTFFIQNKDVETIYTLNTDANGEHVPVIEATVESKLSSYDELALTVPADAEDIEKVEEDYTVIFEDVEGWREYIITEMTDEDDDTAARYVYAELSSIELRDEILTEELSVNSRNPETNLREILAGTRWEVGNVDSSIYTQAFNDSLQYKSVLEAIDLLSSAYSCEVRFSYEVSGNRISRRYVNLYNQFGRDLGKRFEIGKDVESVSRTVDTRNIRTAIIPYTSPQQEDEGADEERLTIEGIEWSTNNGDPVDKPLGQKYLVDPDALAEYGRIDENGTLRNRYTAIEMDTDSVETLINMAWVQLGRYTKPTVTYELNVLDLWALSGDENLEHERVALGDRAIIIDDNFSKPLEVESRVVELTRDLLNPENNLVVLGESRSYFRARETEDQVEELRNRITEVSNNVREVQREAGGSDIYRGSNEPNSPNENDIWFRPHPERSGETQLVIFNGSNWEPPLDTDLSEEVREIIRDAATDAEEAAERAEEAFNKAQEAEDAVQSKVSGEDFINAITQFEDVLNLRIEGDSGTHQINIDQDGILLDAERIGIRGQTFIEEGLIDSAYIGTLTTDHFTGVTIDGETANLININADDISAGDLDLQSIRMMNGNTPVLEVDSSTGEVRMNVTSLTIGGLEPATQEDLDGLSFGGRNYFVLSDYSIERNRGTVGDRQYIELDLEPNTEYTISTTIPDRGSSFDLFFRLPNEHDSSNVNGASVNQSRTVTTEDDGVLVVSVRNDFVQDVITGEHLIKVERGNIVTDWTPAPEDVEGRITDVDEKLGETASDLSDDISDVESKVDNKPERGELQEMLEQYLEDMELEQYASDEDLRSLRDMLEGEIATEINGLATHWVFDDTSVVVGEAGVFVGNSLPEPDSGDLGSMTGVHISPDRVQFVQNGNAVAWISRGHLEISRGTFLESATIGQHTIETTANGVTIWRWNESAGGGAN